MGRSGRSALGAVTLAMGAVLFADSAIAKSDPALKCISAKVQAAGKKAGAQLKCYAKAIGKGITVDAACIAKVESRFDTAFSKSEAKGGCATNGDAASIEAGVDAFVDSVVSSLFVPSGTLSATVSVEYNPLLILELVGIELNVVYPTSKVAIPGNGDTAPVNARVANLGNQGNNFRANDFDDHLFLVSGGTDASAFTPGPFARIVFDLLPGQRPAVGEFNCQVTKAFDSLGLPVGPPTCKVTVSITPP